jgi:hypothetical protein
LLTAVDDVLLDELATVEVDLATGKVGEPSSEQAATASSRTNGTINRLAIGETLPSQFALRR